jgi:GGDEF domain-containing protein
MVDERPLAFCVLGVDGADALRAARLLENVLEQTGRFLQGRFRPEDLRGRWLPDAFALAFSGTPNAAAIANMNRVLEAFAALRLADASGRPVKLSAGIATYPKEGRDAPLTLATAEQRMRAAQRRGGVVVG